MPRSRSMSIQSDVTPRRPPLPCTAPAAEITSACRASASVSVDLPASGWLMTANVRRRRAWVPGSSGTPSTVGAADTAVIALLLATDPDARARTEGTTRVLRRRAQRPQRLGELGREVVEEPVDVGPGVDEREVVVAAVDELLGDLQLLVGVRAAGERLAHVVGGDGRRRCVEVDRVRQLGLHLPAGEPEPEELAGLLGGLVLGGAEGQRDLGVPRALAAGVREGLDQVGAGLGGEDAVAEFGGEYRGLRAAGRHDDLRKRLGEVED